jgi:hypothetical protein
MSTRVCLLSYGPQQPEGGYLWVFLNWASGLRALGCDVIWLVCVTNKISLPELQTYESTFKAGLAPYGFAGCVRFCTSWDGSIAKDDGVEPAGADLLLNVGHYTVSAELVGRFRRSALVDIDPGLTQIWMTEAGLHVAPHDVYFTIGETVGQAGARFPDAGIEWHYTPPCVSLDRWGPHAARNGAAFTTVSHWWGEVETKRDGFLPFLDLPRHTSYPLELALCIGEVPQERAKLVDLGWRVCHAHRVASTPSDYQRYIQNSLGEFSCVKPSCVRLQNAWISDRTLCYLASGKPAVVQNTGPSRFLPEDAGLFRFCDLSQAVRYLDRVVQDYEHQCRLARLLAEEYFDARKVVAGVLDRALA